MVRQASVAQSKRTTVALGAGKIGSVKTTEHGGMMKHVKKYNKEKLYYSACFIIPPCSVVLTLPIFSEPRATVVRLGKNR